MNKRYQEVIIENSTRCNLKCVMCSTILLKDKDKGFMSDEIFENIILYLEGVRWVYIVGGGETFLDKKLFTRLIKVKEKGCLTGVVTHGGLLDEKNREQIFQCGLDSICISFDGATKETYEKIRVGSNYETVMENIKSLIQAKNERKSSLKVVLCYVIMKRNIDEVPLFAEMALGMCVDELLFTGLIPLPELGMGNEKCEDEELVRMIQKVRDRFGGFVDTVNIGKNHIVPKCPQLPEERLFITYKGDVYPCCQWPPSDPGHDALIGKRPVGNVLREPLLKIWEKEEYVRFREMWENSIIPEDCKNCDLVKTSNKKIESFAC